MKQTTNNKGHGPVRTVTVKSLTILFVVGVVLLVRTTGALQDVASVAPSPLLSPPSEGIMTKTDTLDGLGASPKQQTTNDTTNTGSTDSTSSTNPSSTSTSSSGGGTSGSGGSSASTTDSTTTSSGGSTGSIDSSSGSTGGTSGSGSSTPPVIVYRDGTYSVDGSYDTPAGTQKIGITLVLSGGIVIDTSAVRRATNPTSKTYQDDFIANYKSSVVGKDISTLSLGKISGSSLTPNGFNAAVTAIKVQAS